MVYCCYHHLEPFLIDLAILLVMYIERYVWNMYANFQDFVVLAVMQLLILEPLYWRAQRYLFRQHYLLLVFPRLLFDYAYWNLFTSMNDFYILGFLV